jgi:hypothetical protein
MNEALALERGYRRLVACYPRSFRQDNEEEILTVLMATAREGQQRPRVGESWDLLRGALRMRMNMSRTPRTILAAVRLMYAGAIAELAVLIIFALTAYSARADFIARNPHASAAALSYLNAHIVLDWITIPVAIVFWAWMAWANGKGYDWARLVSVACFALNTMALIISLSQDAAAYAPALVIASAVTWGIGLAAITLLFCKPSWRYYGQQVAQR